MNNTFWLKKYQYMLAAQAIILETIEECQHFKQINGSFIKKLKEKNLNVRLDKTDFKKLIVWTRIDGDYTDCCYNLYEDSWEYLKKIISDENWNTYISEIQEKIDSFEEDKKQLIDTINYLDNLKSKNFAYEISQAIKILKQGVEKC